MRHLAFCISCLVLLSSAEITFHGRIDPHEKASTIWLTPRVPLELSASSGATQSTFNWPIDVPPEAQCSTAFNVSVDIIGLYHSRPSALRMSLRHASAAALLANGAGTARRIGLERDRHAGSTRSSSTLSGNAHLPLSNVPTLWSFADSIAPNLAVGASATSSRVMYGADASKAVDGKSDGYFSNGGVFHSGPAAAGAQNWIDFDLGAVRRIGSVRLYDRAFEGFEPEIIRIKVSALSSLFKNGGSFRLRWDVPGRLSTDASSTTLTGDISVTAPAMRQPPPSNVAASSTMTPLSMQEAIESLGIAGRVSVTRTMHDDPAGTGLSDVTWTVTFLNRAGLPPLSVQHSSVSIRAANATVDVDALQLGKAHTWFDDYGRSTEVFGACTADTANAEPTWGIGPTGDLIPTGPAAGTSALPPPSCACGFAPGYLILSTEKLDNISLSSALAHNSTVFAKKLECVWPRDEDGQRETVVPVPASVSAARYGRVQRADMNLLWLAEIQAYEHAPNTFSAYSGGSGILPGLYESESSLNGAFAGLPAAGPWLLQLTTDSDAEDNSTGVTGTAPTGAGKHPEDDDQPIPASLSTWVLHLWCGNDEPADLVSSPLTSPVLSDRNGSSGSCGRVLVRRSFEAQVAVQVHSYPVGGRLRPFVAAHSGCSDSFVHSGGCTNGSILNATNDGGGTGADDDSSSAPPAVPGSVPQSLLDAAPAAASISLHSQADYDQCEPGMLTRRNRDGSQSACFGEERLLKHRNDGAVSWTGDAAAYQRSKEADVSQQRMMVLSWSENRHSVIYEPFQGYHGVDFFQYSSVAASGLIASTDSAASDGHQQPARGELHTVQLDVSSSTSSILPLRPVHDAESEVSDTNQRRDSERKRRRKVGGEGD